MSKTILLSILIIVFVGGLIWGANEGVKLEKEVNGRAEIQACNHNYEKVAYEKAIYPKEPKPLNQNPNDLRNWKIYSKYVNEYYDAKAEEESKNMDISKINEERCQKVNSETNSFLCCYQLPYYSLVVQIGLSWESYLNWLIK